MSTDSLAHAARLLRSARHVVVFTGAGVSAESGVPTFRDAGGFWQEFPPEKFANWPSLISLAATDPARLARFLQAVIEPIAAARPNAAHTAIARLEEHVNVTVVTQNIDGLHQDAGSTVVRQVHGTLLETVNARTGRFERLLSRAELQTIADQLGGLSSGLLTTARLALVIQPIFGLGVHGFRRPDLVLFGDALREPDWSDSLRAARDCDVLLSIGTSGLVMPAAMLPAEAASCGAAVIGIDPHDPSGDIAIAEPAGAIVPRLVSGAFSES
jgi:NAD-dependent deacetylase